VGWIIEGGGKNPYLRFGVSHPFGDFGGRIIGFGHLFAPLGFSAKGFGSKGGDTGEKVRG